MPNISGNAYALTTLCPIANKIAENLSFSVKVRGKLEDLEENENSPMAVVPNTYLCRFYVLDDVFYEGKPANEEHLQSKYLVFSSNFYGDLESYLQGMWDHAEEFILDIWQYCVGFASIKDSSQFIEYIKKCQVTTTFFFNGSTDDPLDEQLKALYLKQEFSKFVWQHQGKSPEALQKAFGTFVDRTQPKDLKGPTWAPGVNSLDTIVINKNENSADKQKNIG